MEIDFVQSTQEELQQARAAAKLVRPSLRATFENCIETYGSTGFSFRKPGEKGETAPAAASIPSEASPQELMNVDILTDTLGNRFTDIGNSRGWPGIETDFQITSDQITARTGFEPDMHAISKAKPTAWERGNAMWWSPLSITPPG